MSKKEFEHDDSVHINFEDKKDASDHSDQKKSQIEQLFHEPVVDDIGWGLSNVTTLIRPRASASNFDDDGEEEDDDKVKEAVHGVYHWIRKQLFPITIMALSLAATIFVFIFDPNNEIRLTSAIGLWIWTALPGMVILVYLASAIIELAAWNIVLTLSEKQPTWLFFAIRDELKTYVRLILFTFALDQVILDWFNYYSGSPDAIQRIETLIRDGLQSVYTVALLLIVRNIFLNIMEYSVTKRSFRKEIYAMGHQIDMLQRLFGRSASEQEELQQLWDNNIERKQFMYRVSAIRDRPIRLHLEQRSEEKGTRLGFSKVDIVELQTTKDMNHLVSFLFDDIANSTSDNQPCLMLPDWRQFFKDMKQAKRTFLSLFSINPNVVSTRIVFKNDFVGAWQKVYKSRSALANQLLAAKNVYKLVSSLAIALFWVIMLFVIARNFGFDVGQVVTAASAFIISFAFATSKTLSRVVESIMFGNRIYSPLKSPHMLAVFVSHPYQVNDSIKINGKWFVVESIGILETRVRDSSNLVTRYSNAVLADMDISNAVFSSHHHVVCIVTVQIAIDTRVDQLEQLRAALVRYTLQNSHSWKPGRVSFFQNGVTPSPRVELEIRVESTVEWTDLQGYKLLDYTLKCFLFNTLTSLNLNWDMSTQPVVLVERTPKDTAVAAS